MARIYKSPVPTQNKKANPVTEKKEDVRKFNTEQLNARAAELGVDISQCKNNGERADAIIAAMQKKAADEGGGAGENN